MLLLVGCSEKNLSEKTAFDRNKERKTSRESGFQRDGGARAKAARWEDARAFEEQRGGPSGWRRVREGAEVGGKVGAAAQAPATRGFQVETN